MTNYNTTYDTSASTLYQRLVILLGVISSKPLIPVIDNFLFEFKEDGNVVITASDLQTTIVLIINIGCTERYSVAIPAKIFMDTLKNFGDDEIKIFFSDVAVIITSDNGRYNIACQNATEYPSITCGSIENQVIIASEVIKKGVQYCSHISSNDPFKPVLNSVYFDFDTNNMTAVALDMHRLVKYQCNNISVNETCSMVVPKKAVQLLMTTLTNDVLRITIHKNHICFTDNTSSIRIITNRITDPYPQYDNIIPKSINNIASVSLVSLISSIKRLLIYANQISRQIQFTFEKSVLTLEAKELNVENKAIEKLECTYEGIDPLMVTFNGRLLLDLIQNIDSETLIMKFSDVDEEHKSNNATIILPNEAKEGENILSLIMPIRM